MQDFRAALMQLTFPQRNSVADNLAIVEQWVARGAEAGAAVIFFGELALTGYLLNTAGLRAPSSGSSEHYRRAQPVPGPATAAVAEIAARHNVTVVAGMGDLQAGVVYNAVFAAGPGGYLGKQRKLHIPDAEYRYYGPGSSFNVLDIGVCKLGVSVCFDNWFPETSRVLALKGAEVLFSPWMWTIPHEASAEVRQQALGYRQKMHRRVFAARALDSAVYVLVLDHVGLEAENFEFPGVSMAFDPYGELIAEAEPYQEQMLLVDLKAAEVEKYRTYGHHYTLKYRRPEIYGALTQPTDELSGA
jgi:predicted amidohydrolase